LFRFFFEFETKQISSNQAKLEEHRELELVSVSSNDTVEQCLHVLREREVLGCPVIEQSGAPTIPGNYIGFVDVLDICGYVLHCDSNTEEFFSSPISVILYCFVVLFDK
jgi:predicted transcriptional regulator